MAAYCPKCGEKLPENASFCLKCGQPIKMEPMHVQKNGLPIAGGALTILASCISGAFGTLVLIAALQWTPLMLYPGAYLFPFLVVSIFAIISFAFGLAGGICSIKRRNYAFSIVGACLVIVSSVVDFVAPDMWVFGVPKLVLSVLGLIFTAVSSKQFT